MIARKNAWFTVLIILMLTSKMSAQSLSNEQVLFTALLDDIQSQHSVSFSYNPAIFDDYLVGSVELDSTLEEVLAQVSDLFAVKFSDVGDGNFAVLPVRGKIGFEVWDNQENSSLEIVYAQVGQGVQQYLFPKEAKFELDNVFPTDSVRFNSRYYREQVMTVADLMINNSRVGMDQDTLYLEDVTVVSYMLSGVSADVKDHSVSVDMAGLGLIAGETDGDIYQVLKAIPGINSPTGKAGALLMRGNSYDQNIIFVDNIPLYHMGHYFGTISPFNPAMVDQIKIHRSALPSQWGGRIGGLIDIRTSNKVPNKIRGSALMNTVFVGGDLSIPVIKDKIGVQVSARSNMPNVNSLKMQSYTDMNMQGGVLDPNRMNPNNSVDDFKVKFNDLNVKIIGKVSDNHLVSLSAMKIKNDFGFQLTSANFTEIAVNESQLDNWGLNGQWHAQFGKSLKLTTYLTTSSFKLIENSAKEEAGAIIEFRDTETQVNDLRAGTKLHYITKNLAEISGGVEWVGHEIQFDESEMRDGQPAKSKNKDQEANVYSSFVNYSKWIGSNLNLNVGLHADYYDMTEQYFVDPRLSLSYVISPIVYLKGSAGRSHQFIQQDFKSDFNDFRISNQFWFLADDRFPVMQGLQYMIGGVWEKSGWLVDIEAYHKNSSNLNRQLDNREFVNGDLTTYGVDVLVKKKVKWLDVWASYTLSKSETDFDTLRNAYFDQTHNLNLMLLWNYHRWNVALGWSLMSGMPVIIPPVQDGSGPGPTEPIVVPYEDRFPVQHQLDLSATYRFSKSDAAWKGVVGLSILNVYNQSNIINVYQSKVDPEYPYRYGIGFAPNLQVTISW